ncbi:MAG: nitrate/sulfonate/bicarbonate ABC transporter ATP-binding protein [Desulfobacteraceae bacterium]|nr:nitrate/sulfonate/bicarbonate ABC transporter ATP-binding protein [Desulfobacteraceae bacterium]
MEKQILIKVSKVKKTFKQGADQSLLVLDDVNLTLKKGEIIALLGRSGSGKSTLLRIIAGLTAADGGKVSYRDQAVTSPVQGIAMVFQSFALMPWLDVMQNVELGLEALGVPRKELRKRALKAIDTIGLDGFESAFPRELSGGMQQRVGLARALVVNPDVLLMDEPFSALDVLTAENLRNDLLDVWQQENRPTNCILLVTHNIEEAVLMADRIVIFDNNPGRVLSNLSVNLPRPRDGEAPEFRQLVDQIYRIMTGVEDILSKTLQPLDLGYRLPDAKVSELVGFMETLLEEAGNKQIELSELSEDLHYDIDDLFPLTEVLGIMRFTEQKHGGIQLTMAGKKFAEADLQERKQIFAKHLLGYIPLARHIRMVLSKRLHQRVSKKYFLAVLEDYLSQEDSERVLRVVTEWGRYAEIFAYDDSDGKLSLENPQ